MKRCLARVSSPARYWVNETHFLCHHAGQTYGIPLADMFQPSDAVVFRPVETNGKRKRPPPGVVEDEPPKRTRTPADVAKEILLELPAEIAVRILVQVPGVMIPAPAMRRWLMVHIHRGTLLAQTMGDPDIVQAWWRKGMKTLGAPPELLQLGENMSPLAYVRLWYPMYTREYDRWQLFYFYGGPILEEEERQPVGVFSGRHMIDRAGGDTPWVLELILTHLRPTPIVAYSLDQRLSFQKLLQETQRMMDAFRAHEIGPVRDKGPDLVFRQVMADFALYEFCVSNPTTSARYSGARCAYLIVICGVRWPSSFPIVDVGTPSIASHDAKVWRRSWNVKSSIFARLRAASNPLFTERYGRL